MKNTPDHQQQPQTLSNDFGAENNAQMPSMAPPLLQLKADPIQRQENGGEGGKEETPAPVQNEQAQPQNEQVNANAEGEQAETEDEKSVTLSRGMMQFITEGDFNGGGTDCTKPHFPQNIYVFQKLTADEKSEEKGKKYEGQRYTGPDDIKRFSASAAGEYKIASSEDRHSKATYTKTLESDQQLGTVGGTSGLTIGFGIDIGNKWATTDKATVKQYFMNGGISDADATKLSEGAGEKGVDAAKRTATLRAELSITAEQVLKVLKAAVKDYDSKGYTRGDGTYHAAIEEVMMYAGYWGQNSIRTAIQAAAKDKEGAEQFKAARDAVKTEWDKLSKNSWKQNGYKSIYYYLEVLTEMAESGYEINMRDEVADKATLLGDADDSFRLVQDIAERKDPGSKGKDLKDQLGSGAIPYLIKEKVGEGSSAINNEDDVTVIQQLLYNGNYDVEVNGDYDAKTKAAIQKFMQDEFSKTYDTVDPNGGTLRRMKKYQYITREEANPAEGAAVPATTDDAEKE